MNRTALLRCAAVLAGALLLSACEKVPPRTPAAATTAPAAPTAPAADVAPAADGLVPGRDYVEIKGGAPLEAKAGTIEVAEAFGYTCPHCAHFEPMLAEWRAKQPADVRFVPVPAPFGGWWQPFAKAYYAAESLGIADETHAAVFDAIHVSKTLPAPPAIATDAQIAAFYAKHGADAAEFAKRMASPEIQQKVSRANDFLNRSGADATPMLIVAGRYRVLGATPTDALRIVDTLVARERAAR
ncbi:thiol:disulfide interchange protein DsbA/DsbL [Lysobacter xanthus]